MFSILLFFVFYLPFQIALNPAEGIDLASSRIFIILFFLVWLAESLQKKKIILKNKVSAVLVVSFLFLNAFSLVVAQNLEWSARKLMFLFSVFPIYFIASNLLNDEKKVLRLAKWIVAGAFASSLVGMAQFVLQFIFGLEAVYQFWAKNIASVFLGKSFGQAVLQNPSWLVEISGRDYLRATAFFPDPHMFSFYLGMSGALCFGLALLHKKRIFFWLVFVVIAVADLLTFSRGGYLALLGAMIFLLIFFWSGISRKIRLAFLTLGILGAILLVVPSPISERFFSIFDFQEGSNAGRIEIWKKAWQVAESHPFFGTGLGNYPLEIKPTADYREPIYAHNTYLDIAVETGILNMLVFGGILFFGFWRLLKKSKENIFFLGAAAAILIFAIHSGVETAIFSPVVLSLLLIILSF